ncbi:hypothetical protein NYR75_09735 [Actinobacillus equuli subsp. haemolyticus]|uniref:hypothetical protein n=1 Tax=Actinobacillus equuli TaxID=718 RepID=UPI00244313EA|nr:hypothetical protein [Actinobacillus equuli]WGE63018.1 hypothetical protein NYR75_09735 [Actinobacillus equuli subsp. haemolyticus]
MNNNINVENLKSTLSKCYQFEYIDNNSDNLLISFTPNSKYFLYHSNINSNRLCLATKSINYYLYNPASNAKKLSQFIVKSGIKNVIIIGTSKAGFASLLWGSLIQDYLKKYSEINIFILSFSPQIKLYPYNETLYFPSYKAFLSTLENDEGLRKCCELYGDVSKYLIKSQVSGMIIYPENNKCDKLEAYRTKGSNIILTSIPSPLHDTIFPFVMDITSTEKVKALVDKIYINSQNGPDLEETLPKEKEDLYKILMSIKTPSLTKLCDALFFQMAHKSQLDNAIKVYQMGFMNLS